ncbi:MAG: minichromosome maintenance protein MCM [bacterium]|nr:minichromosome maintenance protein MCM [bacterium]
MPKQVLYTQSDLENLFKRFFTEVYIDEVTKLAKNYPKKRSLVISLEDIENFDEPLAQHVLLRPEEAIEAAEAALKELDLPLPPEYRDKEVKINVRIKNLPRSHKLLIRNIRSAHIGRLVQFNALVRRASYVKPCLYMVKFVCPKCGTYTVQLIRAKYEFRRYIPRCPNCKVRMEPQLEASKLIDVQLLVVQELPEEIGGGQEPYTIEAWLTDDIAGSVKPGDNIEIVGIPKFTLESPQSPVLKTYVEVVHIEKKTKQFEEIEISEDDISRIYQLSKDPDLEDKIIDSIAPSIYLPGEYRLIKLAIALQLFGGVRTTLPDGTTKRGEIHILLVGDPGTAKSAMLRFVKELAPKAIHVVSKTSTVAGLTAVAVKDKFFGWSIEAGAMVLADGGILLIDELDKFEKSELHGLLEAMEQGTVSIAKAGIVTILNARASVLAAANPKIRFTADKLPIEVIAQTLPVQLISRFDLIFVLRDVPEPSFDEKVAEHIVDSYTAPEKVSPPIPVELLRKYIAYARREIRPVLTQRAREKIINYYVQKRKEMIGADYVTISKRQLEAIIRLAQAHARMRLSETVDVQDIDVAIRLMNFSLQQIARTETGVIDVGALEIGTSLTKGQKKQFIIDIIEKLEEQFPDGVPYAEIKSKVLETGKLTEHEFEQLFRELHEAGEVYKCAPKKYKVTRK